MKWKLIHTPSASADPDGYKKVVRLNSLGSLFWFAKHVLGKNRLSVLHEHLCNSLETQLLFLVMEVPMSHFKTTLGIALSIWWALPWTEDDEQEMVKRGYGRAWVRYMKAMHNQNTRTLVTHEIAGQASNIGKAVDEAYKSNDLFREVFKEILPDDDCTWNNKQKFQKRLPGGDATTGTFEYRGVDQALQGIHANSIIQDDNFGREAQQNLLRGDGQVVEGLIRWHKQVGTRFDPMVKKARRQLVIGNRWAHADLNSWIRKNQPEFKFETHDAEGGCCKLHPVHGQPILPTEWTMDLLKREAIRLGKADYYHFYRNIGTLPGEKKFEKAWLNLFEYAESRPDLPKEDLRNVLMIHHKVKDGEVFEDIGIDALDLRIIADPNHAKKNKRTAHVIWVLGFDRQYNRIYLLSRWQEDVNYSELIEQMRYQAKRWTKRITGQPPIYMGKVGREILEFYLRQQQEPLRTVVFEDDCSLAAMKNRIDALEPTAKSGKFWCHTGDEEFAESFDNYPAGSLDALDVLGYLPKVINITGNQVNEWLAKQREAFETRNVGASGY